MKRLLFLIMLSGFIISCTRFYPNQQYQLVASTDGRVYRLNKTSGEVWLIEPEGTKKLAEEGLITLKASTYYKTEDGGVVRYLGKGKFEPPKPFSEYMRDKYNY